MHVGSRVSVCIATNRSASFSAGTIVAVREAIDGSKRYDVRTDAGKLLAWCDPSSLRAIVFEVVT